jgi:transposase
LILREYPKLAERGDVELAFCWAHMRRNFYDLATPGPAPIASEALKRIAEFYAIEKDIRGRSAEERRLIRQQKSRPLADTFEQWLHAKLALISQKGKLPDAVRYALTRWRGLTRFIDDRPRTVCFQHWPSPIGKRRFWNKKSSD